MPLRRGLRECVYCTRSNALDRIAFDAQAQCQIVGGHKTNAADLARQPIRILLDQPDRIRAEMFLYPRSSRHADAAVGEEQHQLAQAALLAPALGDHLLAQRSDSRELAQPLGLLIENIEDLLAELDVHQSRGGGADAANGAGAEKPFDLHATSSGLWSDRLGNELAAVRPVVAPAAFGQNTFPL